MAAMPTADGCTDARRLDFESLRFDSGRRGYLAAQLLSDDARMKTDSYVIGQAREGPAREHRYLWTTPQEKRSSTVATLEQITKIVRPRKGSPEPVISLLQVILNGDAAIAECRQLRDECFLIARDIGDDGSIDAVLCSVDKPDGIPSQLWDHASGTWQIAVHFNWYPTDESAGDIKRALKAGEITPVRKRWPDVEAANQTAHRIE